MVVVVVDPAEHSNILHYLNYLLPLLEGASVVITTAFIVFRLPFLRHGLHYSGHNKVGRLFLLMFFSLMAIYATHSGMIISPDNSLHAVPWSYNAGLSANEAIINFRDLVVVSAGLVGGLLTGVIVGAVAGFERYQLGGFSALSCALASLFSGVLAGLVHRLYRRKITPLIASLTGGFSVLLQMLLIVILSLPFVSGLHLVAQIAFPVLLITVSGCYLFIRVIEVIEGDRLGMQAYYNAQIEPHFLMNTLNAIRSLIRIDPVRARHYLTHLGEFMRETQHYARTEWVSMGDELAQAQRYIDFQQLRFPDKLNYQVHIKDDDLLLNKIPPRTLLTLVENCLIHGRERNNKLHIMVRVFVDATHQYMVLVVKDNGKGIDSKRLKQIGKEVLKSKHKGGGNGLYNLSQTLLLSFGKDAQLKINSQLGKGTRIRLMIPFAGVKQ